MYVLLPLIQYLKKLYQKCTFKDAFEIKKGHCILQVWRIVMVTYVKEKYYVSGKGGISNDLKK